MAICVVEVPKYNITCTSQCKTVEVESGKSVTVNLSGVTAAATLADESYVVMGLSGDLSAERVLTGTANQVVVTDGGANSTVTLSTPQDIATGSSVTFAGVTVSGLTATRLVATGGGSALASVADLTSWIAGTANQLTSTSDGDGTLTLAIASDPVLPGTGAVTVPDGTTGERPGAPTAGMLRYNTTTGEFEGYTSSWGAIGGGGGATTSAAGVTYVTNLTDDFAVGAADNTAPLFFDEGLARLRIGGTGAPAATFEINSAGSTVLSVDSNGTIDLLDTTTATTGVITKDGSRFIHNFHHPTGSTAIPAGFNLFMGSGAGNFTTGSTATSVVQASYNLAVGDRAMEDITLGRNNMALGYLAGGNLTTGSFNVAIGASALVDATTHSGNMAVGAQALQRCEGNNNVAIGQQAGLGAAATNTSTGNVFLGYFAGRLIDTGNYNICIGYSAGDSLDSADRCIVIGYNIEAQSNSTDGQLTIGNLIFGTGIDGTGTTVSTGKVGIRCVAPDGALEINSATATTPGLIVQTTDDDATNLLLDCQASGGGSLAAVTSAGNVGIGSTTEPTLNGGKVLFFGDNASDPTMGTNTAGIYGKDVSGTVEMFAVDEAGNATQLSPHDTETGEWIFYSENVKTGRRVRVDLERFFRERFPEYLKES